MLQISSCHFGLGKEVGRKGSWIIFQNTRRCHFRGSQRVAY
jgi:hypothetical protein